MTRARTTLVAAALMVVGLAASNAGAQDPPTGHVPPGVPAPPASKAPAEPERGPIRGLFHRLRTQGKKGRSAHPDWTTGGDAKLSKPWLR